jgi:hypothetical protein
MDDQKRKPEATSRTPLAEIKEAAAKIRAYREKNQLSRQHQNSPQSATKGEGEEVVVLRQKSSEGN